MKQMIQEKFMLSIWRSDPRHTAYNHSQY